jgi:hypothetical protein
MARPPAALRERRPTPLQLAPASCEAPAIKKIVRDLAASMRADQASPSTSPRSHFRLTDDDDEDRERIRIRGETEARELARRELERLRRTGPAANDDQAE